MTKMILLLSALLAGFSSSVSLADCPKAEDEVTLTLHEVMRRFGRSLDFAGGVARRASDDPTSASPALLERAVRELQIARDCTAAVVHNQVDTLQPLKAKDLSGGDRDALLRRYYEYMGIFDTALAELQAMFEQARTARPDAAGFRAIKDKERQIRDLVAAAHTEVG